MSERPVPRPAVEVTAAVIVQDGRVLAARRRAGDVRGGSWEFPGGKVEPGEGRAACLARELEEELALRVRVGAPLLSTTHDYPELRVALHAYWCEPLGARGPIAPRAHEELRWLLPAELGALPWSAADLPVVAAVQAALGGHPTSPSAATPSDADRDEAPGGRT